MIIIGCAALLTCFAASAQDDEYKQSVTRQGLLTLEVEGGGMLSTGATAPFWSIHGQGGKRSLSPNSGLLDITTRYRQGFRHFELEAVAEGLIESGLKPIYRVRQAGLTLMTRWGGIQIGAMEYRDPIRYSPQSSGAMVMSNNMLPIPMIMLKSNNFLDFPWTKGWVQIYGEFSAGRFFEDRFNELTYPEATKGAYTHGTLWHHKAGYLRFGKPTAEIPITLTIGGTHAAHWGGRHYLFEEREPSGLKDFLRVVAGKSGDTNATISDQINVLGNHYGQYLIELGWHGEHTIWQLYHQRIFEDKSGIEWNNGMDGMWGLHVSTSLPSIQHIVLEHVTTLDQSGPFHILDFPRPDGVGRGGGNDSYYHNGEYRSGARYMGMNIGNPFLISPLYDRYQNHKSPVRHTRIQAWHFGVSGEIRELGQLQYEIKLSRVNSKGSFGQRLAQDDISYYTYLRMLKDIPKVEGLQAGLEVGADWGDLSPKTFGAGVTLKYGFGIETGRR